MVQTAAVEKRRRINNEMDVKISNFNEKHSRVFVIKSNNLRSSFIHQFRALFREDADIFFGKRKPVLKSLLKAKIRDGENTVAKIRTVLDKDSCLMFTSLTPAEVNERIAGHCVMDYARHDTIADSDFILHAGVMKNTDGTELPVSMHDRLRFCGLDNVRVDNGVLVLEADVKPATAGTEYGKGAHLLKALGYKLARFNVEVTGAFDLRD